MVTCCFLLTSFVVMTSGGIVTVRTGQAILLFSNTSVDNNNKNVTLYANGNRKNTLLATWRWKNGTIEVVNLNPNYKGRLLMDINANIWLLKVDVNDTGKYCINCNQTTTGIAVQLNVLKEMTKEEQIQECLNDTVCMKKYLDSLTGEQILSSLNNLQLDFFKKSLGIDHATTTVQGHKDDTEDKIMPLLSSSNTVMIVVLVMIIISLMFIVTITVVLVYHKYTCCQCRKKDLHGELGKPLLERSQLWKKHFDSLMWEDIMELLNDQQQQSLQTYCENLMWEENRQLIKFDHQQDFSTYYSL